MVKKMIIFTCCICLFYIVWHIANGFQSEKIFANNKGGNMEISSVFKNNERIPSIYTCDGEDTGPELIISGTPQNAQSLMLIIDDPDAPMGLFTHYILFNIPAETTKILPSNPPKDTNEGLNDFRKTSYGGPCPPNGTHRYFFKIYALDKKINLPNGTNRRNLQEAIRGHILDSSELIGLYARH